MTSFLSHSRLSSKLSYIESHLTINGGQVLFTTVFAKDISVPWMFKTEARWKLVSGVCWTLRIVWQIGFRLYRICLDYLGLTLLSLIEVLFNGEMFRFTHIDIHASLSIHLLGYPNILMQWFWKHYFWMRLFWGTCQ